MPSTRRELLGAVASATWLAGCAGSGSDGGGDGSDGGGGGYGGGSGGGSGGAATTTDDDGTPTDTPEPEPTTETGTTPAGPTVQVSTHPDLGEILVGPDGMTLYVFDRDTQGEGASACSGGCADAWPPLTVDGPATAGPDVAASLGTFEREDGTTQVTANGWPLYYFASDGEPGDANGQGVNGVWWVLRPDGTPVRSGMAATTTESPGTTTESDDGYY